MNSLILVISRNSKLSVKNFNTYELFISSYGTEKLCGVLFTTEVHLAYLNVEFYHEGLKLVGMKVLKKTICFHCNDSFFEDDWSSCSLCAD